MKRGKELHIHAPNVSLSGILDTAPFTLAQGRWVEWLGRVIDHHFHRPTIISRIVMEKVDLSQIVGLYISRHMLFTMPWGCATEAMR